MSKLNFLQKLLPPEEKIFYVLFEQGAEVCRDTARLYLDIAKDKISEEKLIEAKRLKHKSNDIAKKTLQQLNATFITPIDREDIQLVASLLNKITKKIVKASVNLRVYRLKEHTESMRLQAETLLRATEELNYTIIHLKKRAKIQDMTDSFERMREIESHGDEILYKAMDDLFSGKHDALNVIKLRDIYKDIENAMDTCFNIADQAVNIILKIG